MNIPFSFLLWSYVLIENRATVRAKCKPSLVHLDYKTTFRTFEQTKWELFCYTKIVIENPNFVLRPGLTYPA